MKTQTESCGATFQLGSGETAMPCFLEKGHCGGHVGKCLGSNIRWPQGFSSEEEIVKSSSKIRYQMCIECNGTGTDSQNSDKCCDTCVGTGAVESIQDRYTSEPEAWKRRAEEEGAKLRNVEPVVPCQTVSELVAKLPMDAFLNQMPLAERIDYAEKLIQSAWDHWKKKEQSEPVKIESDTSAQGAEDYQSEKDATIAALRVELVASLRDRARMSIQLTDHIPVADQMAELRGQIHRLQKDKERLARCLEAIGADRPTAHTDEIWIQINTEIKAARQPE